MTLPRLLVLGSHGGSGFENLVRNTPRFSSNPTLIAEVVLAGCNNAPGKVKFWERAKDLQVPCIHMPKEVRTPEFFTQTIEENGIDFVLLSGWMCEVPLQKKPGTGHGCDPRWTLNIHPGPLPAFGGNGMYGEHVHQAVMAAYARGEVTHSAVCMHFVNYVPPEQERRYDTGPVFLRVTIPILPDDTPESLAARVNQMEHRIQPAGTNLVVQGFICWDGEDPASLTSPTREQWKAAFQHVAVDWQ